MLTCLDSVEYTGNVRLAGDVVSNKPALRDWRLLVRMLSCTRQDPEPVRGVGLRAPFADRRSCGLGGPPNPDTLRLRRRCPLFGGSSPTARVRPLTLIYTTCVEKVCVVRPLP